MTSLIDKKEKFSMDEFFKDKKPSPPPKGKQKIMEKYTKLVMKKLYGKDILVFFYAAETPFVMEYRGIFRDESITPYLSRDYPVWAKDPKCSVTYSRLLYEPDELAPHAWDTIVHEVTHYEGGVKSVNWEIRHTAKFYKTLKRNFEKVDDLRKQFYKEVGWEEDFVYSEED